MGDPAGGAEVLSTLEGVVMQPRMEEEVEVCHFMEEMLCEVFQPQELTKGLYSEVLLAVFLPGQPKGDLQNQESHMRNHKGRI